MPPARDDSRALLLDYGGVLTTPVTESLLAWERRQGLKEREAIDVVRTAYGSDDGGLIGQLERGEVAPEDFELELAALLRGQGVTLREPVDIREMVGNVDPLEPMWELARTARDRGVTVGLLSNSWGMVSYPRQRLDETFDVQVISAEVGLRKPDPAIFQLAVERVGLPAAACAFVDDLEENVAVARSVGMHGVVCEGDARAVADDLSGFLGVPL
jgi:epoxide hydrolase-like predicted phosphatase